MMHNEGLEKYLSEYRPRALRPLQLPEQRPMTWSKKLGVAAAVLILLCAGGGLWYGLRPKTRSALVAVKVVQIATVAQRRPTSFTLTKLALQDDGKFQAELAAESRLALPNFEGERSTLQVFAKE
jgi:hypothetical protein